jgi:excisionase family DNA binding protein
MEAENAKTLSIREAAERLGVTPETARTAARRGDLPAIRVGSRLLILREPFERLLSGHAPTVGSA